MNGLENQWKTCNLHQISSNPSQKLGQPTNFKPTTTDLADLFRGSWYAHLYTHPSQRTRLDLQNQIAAQSIQGLGDRSPAISLVGTSPEFGAGTHRKHHIILPLEEMH